MSIFLIAAVLVVSVLGHSTGMPTASPGWDDQDFFRCCPPSRCSKDGPEVRFPLRLQTSNSSSSCGATCAKLTCYDQDVILLHPLLGPCKVTAIDYSRATLIVIPLVHSLSPCPLQKLISRNLPADAYLRCPLYLATPGKIVQCSREFTPSSTTQVDDDHIIKKAADYIVGPISCFRNQSQYVYLVIARLYMYVLPLDCKAISNVLIPMGFTDGSTFKQMSERIITFSEITVSWDDNGIPNNCTKCSHVKVIPASSSAAAVVVLLLTVAIILYHSLKTRYNKEIHLKVEMFLKTYGTSKPTRYTFSEVKKITRRFKDKVGHGGFGSVYRGELPNGLPVAVKMLQNSTGEGEEFTNEIATIGLIHHANIVRLLGFCSEGTRRAVIYEYMPNESLEKHIFSHNSNISRQLLVPKKMLDIALGVSRGMEYLHQGCNQRILHFDIKPHNILLDYNFNPKISDFGLAKLCARDQSIISLTAARGTMGYIAPELYSPNFGGISYKSDVYSFGMLVLEMVSGRRNSDTSLENQHEVYLPEWIYEKVTTGQELGLTLEMAQEDKENIRKLAIVALWCIQWNPKNRPSMTKVINMLTGRLQNLKIPPKPFVSV
ncbi:putative receptor-like protein kinase [Hordeum vulgare]|nr:putative receptor-like protein kinase [Hordeum vulgare]